MSLKKSRIQPTDGELQILKVIWELGPSTVKIVNDCLSVNKDVGYTTTLKQMQIMFEKGLLNRRKEGKHHIYISEISREDTQTQVVNKILDTLFQGSAMKLVMHALGNRPSSPEELEEIRNYLNSLKEK